MLIRKYRAKNLKEALRQVKADLGDSATILNTRTVPAGLLGSQLEVTATLTPEEPKRPAPAPAPAPSRPPAPPSLEVRDVARFLSPLQREIRALHRDVRNLAGGQGGGRVENVLEELKDLLRGLQQSEPAAPAFPVESAPPPGAEPQEISLDEVARAVGAKLMTTGMRESVAMRILDRIAADLPADPEEALFCCEALAARVISADLSCLDPVELTETPRVVALVGPPGVGKTTTLAKIATRAALVHGKSVAVIGCDTERIGAVQALRDMGGIIGVPVTIAQDAEQLRQALETFSGCCDLILIDTSGHSARDPQEMAELEQLLPDAVEVMLVINADMRGLEIDTTLAGFRRVQPRGLIFTKLDQAVGLGALYEAAACSELPVIYLTNGRRIPEDIEDATPELISSLILGFQYN